MLMGSIGHSSGLVIPNAAQVAAVLSQGGQVAPDVFVQAAQDPQRFFGHTYNRKMVAVADMEPDDYAALFAQSVVLRPDQIPFVGASYMHAGLKAALARRLMTAQGLDPNRVLQGWGGMPDDYVAIESTNISRFYTEEGVGIFSNEELSKILEGPRSSDALVNGLIHLLEQESDVDVVSLTKTTDLARVVACRPDLISKIGHHHMVGGFKNRSAGWSKNPGYWHTVNWDDCELRTTFNGNIDVDAMMALTQTDIPTTLWSVGAIYEQLKGGVGPHSAPGIVAAIKKAAESNQAVRDWLYKTGAWNRHFRSTMRWDLGTEESLAHDFIPADPLGVIGATHPEIILGTRSIRLEVDKNDLNNNGYRVYLTDDEASKLRIVTKIDGQRFLEILEQIFWTMPGLVSARLLAQ